MDELYLTEKLIFVGTTRQFGRHMDDSAHRTVHGFSVRGVEGLSEAVDRRFIQAQPLSASDVASLLKTKKSFTAEEVEALFRAANLPRAI